MTGGTGRVARIVVCRSGVYDEAILAAFADQGGARMQFVDRQDVPRRLEEGADALLIRNSDYDARIGEAVQIASTLGWIQFLSSGMDQLAKNGGAPSAVRVTNCAAALGRAVAEHAIALLLGLLRGIHLAERDRAAARWRRETFRNELASLDGARLAVVGFGAIGRHVATLASAFGADVSIVRRVAGNGAGNFPVLPLEVAIGRADAVVIAVPLSPETYQLLNDRRIAMLRPHCRLVNVSRGGIIDTRALLAALQEGRLHSAALDVFEEEPLAAESALWHLPNVILTPHIAGDGNAKTAQRVAEICLKNYLDIAASTAPG